MSLRRGPSMHRSSESVAAIASALAKAQTELVNPEKSLTAIIRSGRPGEAARSFRYAPLSSGLDIVRKTLGQHEIATVQSTAIDKEAGVVNLTTMLAHASGEWIASDWPVCPVAETANPQRMGAALTYARRYALFTLVGIAGEDDLDAPDLCAPTLGTVAGAPRATTDPRTPPAERPIGSQVPHRPSGNGRGHVSLGRAANPAAVLTADESVTLRDRLLGEIVDLRSQESATSWARQALAAKNRLTSQDAKLVEHAFESRASQLLAPASTEVLGEPSEASQPAGQEVGIGNNANADDRGIGIDKSLLTVAAPRRYRNTDHLRFVSQQPCLLCGRGPSDAHHIRFAQPRALGRKASDEYVVPLCRSHHRAVHRTGDEQAWWAQAGIDPLKVARKLWKHTRIDEGHIEAEPTAGGADPDRASAADSDPASSSNAHPVGSPPQA
jgi:ERF superfamily